MLHNSPLEAHGTLQNDGYDQGWYPYNYFMWPVVDTFKNIFMSVIIFLALVMNKNIKMMNARSKI